jgi:long-chain acyl-CoA synthetase
MSQVITDIPSQARLPRDDRNTVIDLFLRNARDHGQVTAIVDQGRRISWSEYHELASILAIALRDLGVQKGDVVGLHMVNRAEHVIADTGALLAGATPTSFYYTLAPEQLAYVAGDCDAKVAVVEASLLPVWEKILGELDSLEHLIIVDGDPGDNTETRHAWDGVIAGSRPQLADRRGEIDEIVATIEPSDPLTLIYTSGTTGPPKGTIITHEGIRFTTARAAQVLARAVPNLEGHRYDRVVNNGRLELPVGMEQLSYLPLAHVAERFASYYSAMLYAWTVHYVRDLTQLPEMLPKVRPETLVAVPRVWEKLYGGIIAKLEEEPNERKRKLGLKAMEVAREKGLADINKTGLPLKTRLLHGLFEKLVYSKIREAMGFDRCLLAWSGASAISPDLLATFTGMGVVISEVYGMTETSTLITITPPGKPRLGTVGVPIEGMELRIAEDGELLVRGPNITPGYLNKPDKTAEAIDEEGWLHTGDLAEIDSHGYVKIIGRKKELIITSSGKNLSPVNIEESIKSQSPIVGQVLAYGDDKPYITALIVLDPDATPAWCESHGITFTSIEEAAEHPDVYAEVERAVKEGNERLARIEQVKRFRLLATEWTPESEELTPTMKLKRPVVHERYADEIESLYA